MRFLLLLTVWCSFLGWACKGKSEKEPPKHHPESDTIQTLFDSLAQGISIGKAISWNGNPESVSDLASRIKANDTLDAYVWGNVQDVCHAAGCWLRLSSGSDSLQMFVSNLHESSYDTLMMGGYALVHGKVYWENFSAEDEEHLASESGKKSNSTGAKKELVMESDGARFYKK